LLISCPTLALRRPRALKRSARSSTSRASTTSRVRSSTVRDSAVDRVNSRVASVATRFAISDSTLSTAIRKPTSAR
jgi:hypothetical protein